MVRNLRPQRADFVICSVKHKETMRLRRNPSDVTVRLSAGMLGPKRWNFTLAARTSHCAEICAECALRMLNCVRVGSFESHPEFSNLGFQDVLQPQ